MAFEGIFEMAISVLVLAVIVQVMPSSNWQGVVGGPLLIMALVLGVFVVVAVRGLRRYLHLVVQSGDVTAATDDATTQYVPPESG